MTSQLFGKAAPSKEIDGPYESFLTPLLKAERGGFAGICDFIRCFHDTCGHIETKTSCHNYAGNITKHPDPKVNRRFIPCTTGVCDQSVITTICIPSPCVQCATENDPTNPIRIAFDTDPTITRSDPEMDILPTSEISQRHTDYHKRERATQDLHLGLTVVYDPEQLLFRDFGTERFDRSARDLIEHFRQLRRHPGVVEPELFYAELRRRREEEDKLCIDPEHRLYFSGGKFDETDLMERVEETECEGCVICGEEFGEAAARDRDLRGMPCGHTFHWECISQWFYRTNRCCPYCRREYRVVTLPRFLPPP